MSLNNQEITELMEQAAADAILISLEEFNINLDKSVDSVALIDDILSGFVDRYADQALEDQGLFTLCNIYGAYVGEVFRQFVGGGWEITQEDNQEIVMVVFQDKSFAFTGICYERLAIDNTLSVHKYLLQAIKSCQS